MYRQNTSFYQFYIFRINFLNDCASGYCLYILTFIYNGKIKVKLKGNCSKQEGKVSCSYRNVVNVFTVNELDSWLRNSNKDFTLGDCLFEAVNVDLDNCEYSGYGIGFDSRCFIVKCEFGKNVIVWC